MSASVPSQESYQLRMARDGRCRQCGKGPLATKTMCEKCRRKMKVRFARNRRPSST